MGSRHNRKRTRSRPRNRKNLSASTFPHTLVYGPATPGNPSPFSPTFVEVPPLPLQATLLGYPAWQRQQIQQQNCQLQHQQKKLFLQTQYSQRLADDKHATAIETERLRMFGGEKGDSLSLCAPMLQVVMDLFEGNVDYEDP